MNLGLVLGLGLTLGQSDPQAADAPARERGAKAVRGEPAMNPPLWSATAFEALWQQWGLKERPADFAKQLENRYGVYAAPYDNGGLPMGMHYTKGLIGKGVINDCLLCHAGRVAGQTVIGLGNASLDLQGLFDELGDSAKLGYEFPFRFSYVRGTIDPVNPVAYLMEFRKPDLTLQFPKKLEYTHDIASDPPAWWLLKRKKTRNWTGGVDVNSVRIDMINLLTPLNSPAHIKSHEKTFADIHAFVMSVEPPRYPFAIDPGLAETGRKLFNDTCARCHGTYGPQAEYPNKVIPLKALGTDPRLAQSISPKNLEYMNKTWFAQEKAANGGWYTIAETPGYQAPPLDGVWATAPYLHNGSVPTIAHLLDSKSRPRIFTRTFGTEKEDYDQAALGWKIAVLEKPASESAPPYERRKVYDTTLPGLSNAGHAFGDHFTEAERRAVIEYLKTL